MLFCEDNKSISLAISGYEFPDSPPSSAGDFTNDANWLLVEVRYSENGRTASQVDSCLLTSELSDLYHSLSALKDRRAGAYMSEFMEPYLKISVIKADGCCYAAIRFVYDTSGETWQNWEVCTNVSDHEYQTLLDELRDAVKCYPAR